MKYSKLTTKEIAALRNKFRASHLYRYRRWYKEQKDIEALGDLFCYECCDYEDSQEHWTRCIIYKRRKHSGNSSRWTGCFCGACDLFFHGASFVQYSK